MEVEKGRKENGDANVSEQLRINDSCYLSEISHFGSNVG